MRHLFNIILLFGFLPTFGQAFGEINTSGLDKQKRIERGLDKQIAKGIKKKNITNSIKNKNGDTLTYIVQHVIDPFTLKLVFNIHDTIFDEKYCGFQEYIFPLLPHKDLSIILST